MTSPTAHPPLVKPPSATAGTTRCLLRCRRVADLLDITTKHVYRLVHEGELEAVRVGLRGLRITRESLDHLLERWRLTRPAYPDDTGDMRSYAPAWRVRRCSPARHSTNPPKEKRS
jgi:excisionase family DNA binding protein